jgi:uncharacterized membrane protein
MAEFLILVLGVAWLVDRARLQHRIDSIESALERLTRESAINREARRQSAAAPGTAPTAPAPPILSTSRAETAVPHSDDVRRDALLARTAPTAAARTAQPAAALPTSAAKPDAGIDSASRGTVESARHAQQGDGDWMPPPISELPGVRQIREFFTGGNLIVRVGVIVLFFGVAFLLRYAAEHSHLSIETRLSGVAVGAIVLLALGWHWRDSRRGYALALQGGGVGILYLTTFTAQRIYGVLPPGAAFTLLALVALLSAALAILQDSMAFAVLGATGGYLAPVLAANPHGDHVVLFSYFALLNCFVLIIAWFRSWRPLNLLAFVFTYAIGTAWGVLRYQPENFATTEPFVALFFVMFVTISVLYAIRRGANLTHYVDGTLVFGVPVMTMGIQAGLVSRIPYALAYSALTLSAFYLALAWTLRRRRQETLGLLVEALLALGVAFVTLALPFALEGRWTAASWALEGAAIVWVGLRQDRRLAVFSGMALQLLAGAAHFWESFEGHGALHETLFLNSHYLAAILVSTGGIAIAAMLRREGPGWLEGGRPVLSVGLFIWGLLWWCGGGSSEIQSHVAASGQLAAHVAYFGVTALILTLLGARLAWTMARVASLLLLPILAFFALESLTTLSHPLQDGGWWAWPLSIALGYLALRRDEAVAPAWLGTALHALGLWLVIWAVTGELVWQTARVVTESPTWSQALLGVIPAAALLALMARVSSPRWPFADHAVAYVAVAGGGLTLFLAGWNVHADFASDGLAAPLPYIPIASPMDIAQGLGILALASHWRTLERMWGEHIGSEWRRALPGLLALISFAWLNVLLLRTLHHYANVPYTLDGVAASTLAQTSLTIFWTTLALLGMAWATRSGRRIVWLCGATLLGLVILKLFLVDLSRTGTVLRIVSFLGVGVLMLVIGYLSPIPPRRSEAA